MKILDLKVMRGPNIWSNYRQKLIVMRLDLEELEKRPTHRIEGFADRIKKMLPSLYGHRCSEANKGGFFQRVEQGTWMGHVIEHIALEMQTLAGMDCGYGRTRSTDKEGVYNVVFAYRVEEAGLYAANAAVTVADALVRGINHDINHDITELREIAAHRRLPGNTNVIIDEAHRAEIPYHLVNDSLLILGYGINQVKMRDTLAGTSSSIALEIADHRHDTKNLLQKAQVQVPPGREIEGVDELQAAFEELGAPLVVKPLRGYHQRRISAPLQNEKDAVTFLQQVLNNYKEAIIEKYIFGDLFRVLLIDYKVIAVTKYPRHRLEGDGRSSLSQLIERHPNEGGAGRGFEQDLVVHDKQEICIDGQPEEYTGELLQAGRACFERIARLCDLNVCCVDVLAGNLASFPGPDQGSVIAVEARPNLTDFLKPSKGNGRNVITPMFDMLFGKENGARIPLVAVRGNGESRTISLLIAHICDLAGKKTGVAGKSGIQICGHLLSSEACRGHESVRGVLFDPGIDTAVVECATEHIMESGLAFDTSEISIITGSRTKKTRKQDEVVELEKQADLAVGRTTPSHGHLIFNADNDCHHLADDLYGQIVLYTTTASHPSLKKHCDRGRVAAYPEDGQLVLQKGKWKIPIIPLVKMHIDLQAALPAVLAAWLLEIDTPLIASALVSFSPAGEAIAV